MGAFHRRQCHTPRRQGGGWTQSCCEPPPNYLSKTAENCGKGEHLGGGGGDIW